MEKSPEHPGLNKYSNSGAPVKGGLLSSHPLGTAWGRHPFSLAQNEHCRTLSSGTPGRAAHYLSKRGPEKRGMDGRGIRECHRRGLTVPGVTHEGGKHSKPSFLQSAGGSIIRGTPWVVGAPPAPSPQPHTLSKTHSRSLKEQPRLGKDPAGNRGADGRGRGHREARGQQNWFFPARDRARTRATPWRTLSMSLRPAVRIHPSLLLASLL